MPGPFSFVKFGGITNTKPDRSITLKEAYTLIKKESALVKKQNELRAITDKKTAREFKSTFPWMAFSGTFSPDIKNETLQKHSGLLCIDFDGVQNLSIQIEILKKDPYTALLFISPSGKGLKCVVKINPEKHLESFLYLKKYYHDTYDLKLDEACKDVRRACFLAYDPKVYYNSASKIAPYHDVDSSAQSGTKKVINPEARVPKDMDREYRRAQWCAQQIEENQIDITGEYNDWVQIGMCLSLFGDKGRQIFHQVSKFHDEYDSRKTDEKFDGFLQGRESAKNDPESKLIKTPAKFFAVCRDYGLDTKLPAHLKAKPAASDDEKAQELRNEIGNDDAVDEYNKYGFWARSHPEWKSKCYYGINTKGNAYEVSNFEMSVLYHVKTDDDTAYRLVTIKNKFGYEVVLNLNTDDFVSLASFRKILARQGNFLWKGTEADLGKLQDKLQRDERATTLIKVLGYYPKGNFWAWGNGIIDCTGDEAKFKPLDEYGIVRHKYRYTNLDGMNEEVDRNFFIPARSKMYAEKDDLFQEHKKFIYMKSNTTFKQWSELFIKAYEDKAKLAIAFYISTVFSDIIFKELGGRFPIFGGFGKRGTAKTAFVQRIMALFGKSQEPFGLSGQSTQKAFIRKTAQFRNAPVQLDEYKNSLPLKIIDSLKDMYQRQGYSRARMDMSFDTDSIPINSTIFLTGQDLPTKDAALFQRVLLIQFFNSKFKKEQRDAWNKLKEIEDEGLSHLTVELIQYRYLFEKFYKETYETERAAFVKFIGQENIEDRFIDNYSAMIATISLISDVVDLPFNLKNFKEYCKDLLLNQAAIMSGSDDLGKFWETMQILFNSGVLIEDKHFKLSNGELWLRLEDCVSLYEKDMRQRGSEVALEKGTIINYFEGMGYYKGKSRKNMKGSRPWVYRFDYQRIGVDLIKLNENESGTLAQKLRALGMHDLADEAENDEINEDLGNE